MYVCTLVCIPCHIVCINDPIQHLKPFDVIDANMPAWTRLQLERETTSVSCSGRESSGFSDANSRELPHLQVTVKLHCGRRDKCK